MMNRELLELAAKATGMWPHDFLLNDEGAPIYSDENGFYLAWGNGFWNPLTNDGDALRLGVKLEIDLIHFTGRLRADVAGMSDVHQMHEGDPYAATRRAIVRAAAEIGRGANAR